jgi:hypothetical protein
VGPAGRDNFAPKLLPAFANARDAQSPPAPAVWERSHGTGVPGVHAWRASASMKSRLHPYGPLGRRFTSAPICPVALLVNRRGLCGRRLRQPPKGLS